MAILARAERLGAGLVHPIILNAPNGIRATRDRQGHRPVVHQPQDEQQAGQRDKCGDGQSDGETEEAFQEAYIDVNTRRRRDVTEARFSFGEFNPLVMAFLQNL